MTNIKRKRIQKTKDRMSKRINPPTIYGGEKPAYLFLLKGLAVPDTVVF